MKFENIPIIRMEIEGMKANILNALGLYGSELGEVVKENLEKAIKEYPFEEIIKQEAYNALDSAIKNYFAHGKGRELIESIVDGAINGVEEELTNG
jgi:hypothetical protein